MARLAEFSAREIAQALKSGRFRLTVSPFTFRIDTRIPELGVGLRQVYADYPVSLEGGRYDFDLAIRPASPLRHWFRRNAVFALSGQEPFLPMTAEHAHALLEWGMNWVIGSQAHQYLILHSAVVEKHGRGVMLAAMSGSGKSTLTAELVMRGWRLFSDELAMIDTSPLRLVPFPRPVSLKNQSIELIRQRHPAAVFGPLARDTQKGTIAHLRAPQEAVDRGLEAAPPALIIFPRWSAGAPLQVTPVGAGQAAMRLIDQSFNYALQGRAGFQRLADLTAMAPAWEMTYASLDEAVEALEDLVADVAVDG